MEDKIDHVDLGDTYVGEGHHYITFDICIYMMNKVLSLTFP